MPKLRLPLPDADDLHVYGGLVLLAIGVGFIHVGVGLAVFGAGLIALGGLYSYATASEARQERRSTPGAFEAMKTATPPAEDA